MHKLKELAQAQFGSPSEAHIDVRTHGIVGEFGRHHLGFIAGGPHTQLDDFAKERLDERIADLVQSTTSDLKRNTREACSASGGS